MKNMLSPLRAFMYVRTCSCVICLLIHSGLVQQQQQCQLQR